MYDSKVSTVVITIATIITIVAVIFAGVMHYQLWRELDSLIDRAQVSADAQDMHGYMEQVQANMQKVGATTGYTAIIFRGPSNDMSLTYKAVERINQRLTLTEGMPKNDTSYQVAIDDIRGIIRELSNPADGLAWVRYWVYVVWGGIVLWIIVGFVWWRNMY